MKLSKILYHIDESRKLFDAEYGFKKISVIENPGAIGVINELDKSTQILGGWISKNGSWIWRRDDASHNHIAKQVGIYPKESIAFYIKPEGYDNQGKVLDVNFEVSEFSGSKSFSALMKTTLINNIMKILSKRKDDREEYNDFNVDDLISSMNAKDY